MNETTQRIDTTTQPEIVVGVSGSRASVAALRWAADEARRRHTRLSVVCAWDHSLRPAPYAEVGGNHTAADARAALHSCLEAAMRVAFGPVPPAGIDTELTEGVPERVLIDRSAIADLLVLGTARPQDAAGLSVGPVIRACLGRARCPVVVVNAGAGTEAGQRLDYAQAARASALTG
jgi:nucleotide-binding universal stress UspA family protein